MRLLPVLLAAAALGSCNTAPTADMAAATDRAQTRLAGLTAGKVAGTPVSCLPNYRANRMTVIDENTVAFWQTRSRIYVNQMQGPCPMLGSGSTAMVTRTTSGNLCRGDIAYIVDNTTGASLGSCVVGDFVPYMAARG